MGEDEVHSWESAEGVVHAMREVWLEDVMYTSNTVLSGNLMYDQMYASIRLVR